MLLIYFDNLYHVFSYIFFLIFLLLITFKFYKNSYQGLDADKISSPLSTINIFLTGYTFLFSFYYFFLVSFILVYMLITVFDFFENMSNQLVLSEFLLSFTFILCFVMLLVFIFFYKHIYFKLQKIEFFLAKISLVITSSLIYIAAGFLSFFFLLELLASLILFLFATSSIVKITNLFKKYQNTTKKPLFSILFFQFWASFLSSGLLVFFLIVTLLYFSNTEYYYLNFFYFVDFSDLSMLDTLQKYFIFIVFFLGFFLKMGFSPVHLYKIEIYRGVSLFTILLYTLLFFLVFLFVFYYLLIENIPFFLNFLNQFQNIFFFILSVSALTMMFDVQYLKIFFLYSSIMNSLLTFILLFCSVI